MLCRVVANIVRWALNDDSAVVWSDSDLIDYLNDGLLATVLNRPDANAVTEDHALVVGSKQSLPTGGLRLLSVNRNVSGAAIRRTDRDTLDLYDPLWMTKTGAIIREYIYDDRIPKQFFVNPGMASGGGLNIELSYSKIPTIITDLDADDFPIDDIYSPAVIEWILYRCWTGDTENTPTYAKAQAKHQSFFQILGVKTQADTAVSPKVGGHLK